MPDNNETAVLGLFRMLSEPQKISYLARLRSLALPPEEKPARELAVRETNGSTTA